MKICLIGTVAASTLNFRKNLIELLAAQGHEIHVFATDYTESSRKKIQELGGIPVSYSLNRGGLNPLADIRSTLQLKKIISRISPDIVFSYFSKPVIFGTLAAKMAGVQHIFGMLEGLGFPFTQTSEKKEETLKKRIIKNIQINLYKLSFKHLKKIIFLNKDDYNDLVISNNISSPHYSILGGIGVDIDFFSKTTPSNNPIRFIFIGRFLKEKGIFEYIEAAKIVKSKYPDVEFIALGGIDKENPSALTQSQLDSLLADGTIVSPGHVNSVKEWLHASSVFVLPSYREGIPCSAQEALACGLPIITTNVPGCRETVEHLKNGFIVPPFSSRSVAESMLFFIENRDQIFIMGEQSRFLAQSAFDSKIQNQKLLDIILS